MRAIAITGLAAEARVARRLGLRAVAAGGNADRTTAEIERLVAAGASGFVSFGICGGLDPALASGTMLLPAAARSETGERYAVDQAWHDALMATLRAAGLSVSTGDILGAAAIVHTPARKAALFRESGTVAVDLESHLVARAARAAEIPFVIVRAVADPAGRGLPAAALVGLDAEGRVALGAVLSSIARRPGQIPALLQVALDTRRALGALFRGARTLGGGLSVGVNASHGVLDVT